MVNRSICGSIIKFAGLSTLGFSTGIIVFVVLALSASAQGPEIAVAGGEALLKLGVEQFGAKKVSDIINQIGGTGDEWIQRGQASGNGLLTKAGTEGEMFAENLNSILSDERDKTFNQLQ